MGRLVVSSWSELCRYIEENKGKNLRLKPIEWTGKRKLDRKTKQESDIVDENEVWSIIFEVEKDS